MSLSVGINLPSSILDPRTRKIRPFDAYRRWFIGFGLAGLVYSSFAWSVVLAGNGRSRVELALQLPLKGLIRFLEWIHCPEVFAFVVTLFPPLTGLMCGLLAVGACWAWRALGLRWDRAKHVVLGTAVFQLSLVGYASASATVSGGAFTLPGRGDSLLALALVVLFVGGVTLVALSPHLHGGRTGVISSGRD
jgi:hypothetical protein